MSKIKQLFQTILKGIGKGKVFVKGHKIISAVVAVVLVGAVSAVAIVPNVLAANNTEGEMTQRTSYTELTKMDLSTSISVTGTIASASSETVTSTLNGVTITEVNVSEGDYVNEGDVICSFDTEDLQEALESAENSEALTSLQNSHSLSEAQDAVTEAEEAYTEGIEDLQEAVDSALAAWESAHADLITAQANYSAGAITSDELSKYQSAADSAYAAYAEALENQEDKTEELADAIETAKYNLEVVQLQVAGDSSSSSVDDAEENLSNAVIYAPISGYVTSVGVTVGEEYTGGDTIVVIQDTENLIVSATVDEYDIASISEGLEAVIKTDATDDEEFSGTVTYVATAPASSSSSSGTSTSSGYSIEITLSETSDDFRIGMTAKGSIILESATDVFAVAYDAIQTDEEGNSYITVLTDESTGETEKIYVTTGLESDYYVEISGDDLEEGMKVVSTVSTDVTNVESDSSDDEDSSSLLSGLTSGGNSGGGGGGGGDMGGGGGGAPGGM